MAALSRYVFVSASFGIIKRKYYFQERTDNFRVNVYLSFKRETPDLVWKVVVWDKFHWWFHATHWFPLRSSHITQYVVIFIWKAPTEKLCGYHLYILVGLSREFVGAACSAYGHSNTTRAIQPELYDWWTVPLMKYIQVLDVKYSDAIWQGCSASAICHL